MAAITLIWFELRAIRKEHLNVSLEAAWPQFEDTYISALQSGIYIPDAFSFANDFELPKLGRFVKRLVDRLDRGVPLARAKKSRRKAGNGEPA